MAVAQEGIVEVVEEAKLFVVLFVFLGKKRFL